MCRIAMCDACFEHKIDGWPACTRCTYELATRQQRSLSLGITITGLGAAVAFWSFKRGRAAWECAAIGLGGLVLAIVVALLLRIGKNTPVERRDRAQEAEEQPLPKRAPLHPYRQRARHVAMRLSPKISGSGATFALLGSFAIAAVALPTALDLPRWIEIELVLGAWWLAVTGLLGVLLYRGYRMKDDYVFVSPFRRGKGDGGWNIDPGGCDMGCGGVDAEGVVIAIGIILAVLLAIGAAWILVELALPVLIFAAYTLLLSALRHVAHDRHGCEGSLAKSVGWGAVWASVYIVPLGLLTALFQYVVTR